MRPIDKFHAALSAISGKPRRSGNWFAYKHPCNPEGDTRYSLRISEAPDGSVAMKSHKPNYSNDDVLERLGLTRKDYFEGRSFEPVVRGNRGMLVAEYQYTNRAGMPIGIVQRFKPPATSKKDKDFSQLRVTEKGERIYSLDGFEMPMFQLPIIEDAIRLGKTLWLTEGEKDALALLEIGEFATTKPGGSDAVWTESRVQALKGAHVRIVADKDTAGYKAATAAYNALLDVAASLEIVEAKEGKDAFDHLQLKHGLDAFVPRPDLAKLPGLNSSSFNGNFEAVKPEFLWEPYLPIGKAILVDGNSGTRKTTAMLAIAAGLSNGVLPKGGKCPPCKTLYILKDKDTPAEYETVYRANGGKPGMIHYVQVDGDWFLSPEMMINIRNEIRLTGAKLVVFDPFLYMLPVKDLSDPMAVAPYCAMLGQLAATCDASVVAVRHETKGGTGAGSWMLRAQFRGNLMIKKHPDRPGVILLIDDKGSILVPQGETLGFRGRGAGIEWLTETMENPFEGLAPGEYPKKASPGRPSKHDAILASLCDALARGGMLKGELVQRAMDENSCGKTAVYDVYNSAKKEFIEVSGFVYLKGSDPLS